MKKTLIVISFLVSLCCNAQFKTQSNYDVDGDGNVNIADVSTTVQAALGKAVGERQVFDAEYLKDLLQSIENRLDVIEEKLGIEHSGPLDTHDYVDLGLSVKWATTNVGANSPEEYGNYYAWGETKAYGEQDMLNSHNFSYGGNNTKTYYDWSTYKWSSGTTYDALTKYNTLSDCGIVDMKVELDLADDAAYVNWGSNWRMPTRAEWKELISGCTWKWTTLNGKNGYKVTSNKDSSKYIFLPAAGRRKQSELSESGDYGYYWNSVIDGSNPAATFGLYLRSADAGFCLSGRCEGYPVRPVRR